MKIQEIKQRVKKIIDKLDVIDYTCQVRVQDVCRLADITIVDLYAVIEGSMVCYGMYNIQSLQSDIAE